MKAIFINTESSIRNESHRFRLTLADKLKNPHKNMVWPNLSIYYKWKNIKFADNNIKFKISAPTWNDEFDLGDGLYSTSDIQDYFEYIIKKNRTKANNPPVQIYANKIKNRIVFKIKTSYKLELLSPETTKLLGSTKKGADQNKNGENLSKLEPVKVVLKHCNLVNNSYLQTPKVLSTFMPSKEFGQLITIPPHSLTMLDTTNTEFSSTEVGLLIKIASNLKQKIMLI